MKGAGRLRSVVANVALKALPAPIEKGCRLLLVALAAPIFGAAKFGTYQFATTVTALLTTCTELGLGTWTTRSLARDPGRASPIVAGGLRLRVLLFLPCVLAIAFVALREATPEARDAVMLLGVAALLGSLVDYFGAILRGYEDFGWEAVTNVARALLTFGSAAFGLLYARSLTGLATGLLAGGVASAALGRWIVSARTSRVVAHVSTRSPPLAETEPLRASALLPLWLASLLSTLYFRCDLVLMRAFVTDAEIGYYGAAYRVFEALLFIPTALMAVGFPRLSRAALEGDAWTPFETRLLAGLGGLGFLAAAGLYLGSDLLVARVFGAGFERAAVLVRLLAVSTPVLWLNFGLTASLFARGAERAYLVLVAAMFVVNVGANLVAIPRWGGAGAAWSTFATEALLALGCLAVRWKSARRGSARLPA